MALSTMTLIMWCWWNQLRAGMVHLPGDGIDVPEDLNSAVSVQLVCERDARHVFWGRLVRRQGNLLVGAILLPVVHDGTSLVGERGLSIQAGDKESILSFLRL